MIVSQNSHEDPHHVLACILHCVIFALPSMYKVRHKLVHGRKFKKDLKHEMYVLYLISAVLLIVEASGIFGPCPIYDFLTTNENDKVLSIVKICIAECSVCMATAYHIFKILCDDSPTWYRDDKCKTCFSECIQHVGWVLVKFGIRWVMRDIRLA
ncbi:hypothetical protein MAR_021898 [Mya arenaria]|nr:hypothetical protein MAR_021898 [Mya arenaria]